MSEEKYPGIFLNELIKKNPAFVLVMGICPAIATTNTAINGLSIAVATALVLFGSNLLISLLKNIITAKLYIISYLIIIATLVSIIDIYMQIIIPAVHNNLGIFVPLIVVNCLILGYSELFASKNNAAKSMTNSIIMGISYITALTSLGIIRELLGTGKIFSYSLFPEKYGALLFILAPGALITLAYLIIVMNKFLRN